MQTVHPHPWNVTPREARDIQDELRHHVVTVDRFDPPAILAGVNVGFEENNTVARAAVALLDASTLTSMEVAVARRPVTFPYIPGLLSFREIPAVLDALAALSQRPGMLLCDGQGIAHPRRMGIAAHLGLLCDLPSIGVAKSRLVGTHPPVGPHKGDRVPLFDKEESIGAVVRTRDHVKPLYISTGHRVSSSTAVSIVLGATTRYRLPETTRAAHKAASG